MSKEEIVNEFFTHEEPTTLELPQVKAKIRLVIKAARLSKEEFFKLPTAEQKKRAEKSELYQGYLKEGKSESKGKKEYKKLKEIFRNPDVSSKRADYVINYFNNLDESVPPNFKNKVVKNIRRLFTDAGVPFKQSYANSITKQKDFGRLIGIVIDTISYADSQGIGNPDGYRRQAAKILNSK